LVIGYWLLVIVHWLLVIGYWSLMVIGLVVIWLWTTNLNLWAEDYYLERNICVNLRNLRETFLTSWGSLIVIGCHWLLVVIGHWLSLGHWVIGSLVIGYWSLVIGYWSLVIGYWLLVIGHWVTGHWVSGYLVMDY